MHNIKLTKEAKIRETEWAVEVCQRKNRLLSFAPTLPLPIIRDTAKLFLDHVDSRTAVQFPLLERGIITYYRANGRSGALTLRALLISRRSRTLISIATSSGVVPRRRSSGHQLAGDSLPRFHFSTVPLARPLSAFIALSPRPTLSFNSSRFCLARYRTSILISSARG